MNPALQLAESERQRLLQAMGFDIWVRRGSEPLGVPALKAAASKTPPTRAVSEPRPEPAHARNALGRSERLPTSPTMPSSAAPADSVPTARARATVSARLGAQSVLLILEKRIDADAPFIKQLMQSLPGCTICTPDTIARGTAKFALQVGVDATLPADVLGVRAPTLEALRQSASARRALWWSIKPMLKALKA